MKKKLIRKAPQNFDAAIKDFVSQFAQLSADRVTLCQYLVRLIDQDKYTAHYINQECPKLSMAKLKLMERVGRGDFHEALLDAITPAECMLAKMDYQAQKDALEGDKHIPVMTVNDKGEYNTVLLPVLPLTQDQVDQVSAMVNGKRVYKSMKEQRSWLVDHRTNLATRPSRKTDKPKWIIQDGVAVILGKNPRMTLTELLDAAHEINHSQCNKHQDDQPEDDDRSNPGQAAVPKKPTPTPPVSGAKKRLTLKELAARKPSK